MITGDRNVSRFFLFRLFIRMIKIKIGKKRVLELDRSENSTEWGAAGEPNAGGDQRYANIGMEEASLDDGTLVCEACLQELLQDPVLEEAKYHGKTVQLNKPSRGDVKKFKVFVKDPKTGNIKKVNFGDPNMRIKKNNPKRRKSFRARHHCKNPGPKTKARYWSCKKW